ncbi:DEKNAAC102976 [Brettanomyces naardenensis]|uniref:DEKNAAC102976 n=1 Tax=Brettanomyces naardenensis TaxID=13370 RepID=A0A448YM66_BRENA|nr:DEKNAAC102976 [Brettanomyces naardenensis]
MSMSAADKEKALVEKVELRLALADTDQKFQDSLGIYLTPLLLKFASPHSSVRAQVGKTVRFLLTRINSSPSLQLPVDALLEQVKNPQVASNVDPSIVQSYTLVFLSKGINRVPTAEQNKLIPKVIEGISGFKTIISARLFNILCKLILNYDTSVPNVDDGKKFREFMQFDGINAAQEDYLIEKFYKFMLLQPVRANTDGQIPKGFSLPGLSKDDCAFLTYDAGVTFDSTTLAKYKSSILRFVQYGFSARNSFIYFMAASDPVSSVADLASNLLRRKAVDHEDEFLVDRMISIFLGDKDLLRPAARVQLQEKIMNFLGQSERATRSPLVSKLISAGMNSEYGKLKQATVKFIRWMTSRMATETDEGNLTLDMAVQLRENLQRDKQVEVTSNMSDYLLQRRYQYEALGLILRRSATVADYSFIEFLFDMLRTEILELRASAQEALSGLTVHLSALNGNEKEKLKQYLKGIIQSEALKERNSVQKENEQAARYMATKFVNCTFPFDDPEARLLDIEVQTEDDKPETIEEATKGLHPYWFQLLQSSNSNVFKSTKELIGAKSVAEVRFPSFDSMVRFIVSEATAENLSRAITFSIRCLVMQAIRNAKTVVVIDTEWENRIENAIDFDPTVRSCIIKELDRLSVNTTDVDGDVPMTNSLETFLQMGFDLLSSSMDLNVGKRLTKVLALCPAAVVGKSVNEIPALLDCLPKAFSSEASSYLSQLLGILCSNAAYSDDSILSTVDRLLKSEDLRALGFIISRLALTDRLSLIDGEKFEKLLSLIDKYLESSSSTKSAASLNCLSQLSMFGCLGPIRQLSKGLSKYKVSFIRKLKPLIKKHQDDLTAMTWSFLGLSGTPEDEIGQSDGDEADENEVTKVLTPFERALYEAHSTKHLDYLFSIGEALTVLAYGWKSQIMDGKIDVQNAPVGIEQLTPSINRISVILDVVLKACDHTQPSVRKAGCIWLLSLVQYCGDSKDIKSSLNEIQVAFMKFLTDREDLIQESASRGLSIVYDKGDYELRDELVHNLLLSFTDSNKASSMISGSIGSDTKLFEPGVLKTEDGSVSTYKDILNLASEVGDPSLVYKFMSLAKNSALWSSRKGIAYGLGAVLDKSKLDEMLSKDSNLSNRLIPKLYRYRFDPSPSVSRTMDDIWSSLVLDSGKTIADNFETILTDVLKGMGNHEWRMRQASAAALNDLLRHVPLTTYEAKLGEIWTMAFRSMDDIKESVRKEGNLLTRYLATTMVHRISGSKKGSEESLKQLIPFLLGNSGLLSDAEDVKSFAFDTILEIAETSSVALKPFINEMIQQMILLMSSVEPQVVNYLSLNADKYKLKSQDIDMQRLNMVGSSSMMGAIEKLMNLLDESLMPEFIEKLANAVKTAVGLPSKVTGSKVVVDLIVKHFFVAQNYGDELLKISMGQLKNHNETVSGSYAIATGYCIRIASLKKIRTLSKKLTRYYFDAPADNNHLQEVSSRTCAAVADYSKDKFQSVASGFLPLAFIGKHDLDDKVSDGFKKAWDASIGSGSNAIKLYFKEIIDLIKLNIGTTNFALRQAIGLSVIEIIDRLGTQVGTLSQYLDDLYNVLLESLQGRSYRGKEKLLNSLVLLVVSTKGYLDEHEELYGKVSKCVLTEARRRNKAYKKFSIKSLGKFLGSCSDDPQLYEAYIELVDPLLNPSKRKGTADSDSSMDTDSDSDGNKGGDLKKIKVAKFEEFRNSLLENLVVAVNRDEPNIPLVNYILDENLPQVAKEQHSFKSKLVAMNVLTELINKLDHADLFDNSEGGKVLAMKAFHIWTILTETSANRDSLQTILVSYIRLTRLVATTIAGKTGDPDDIEKTTASLEMLLQEKVNSVITTEAEKALKKLKAEK